MLVAFLLSYHVNFPARFFTARFFHQVILSFTVYYNFVPYCLYYRLPTIQGANL